MHFQIAASILVGCVAVQALADTPADTKISSAVSILSSVAHSRQLNNRPRRLLQRLKKRRDAATFTRRNQSQSGEGFDVGILAKSAPRFLQDTDYDYYCPRDTCPTELCDCADSGGSLEDCTSELQSVCRNGKLGDCVYAAYVKVYEEVYCPFVSCIDQGFREDQCDCAFYELYCSRLKSEECGELLNDVDPDDPDKKPFFGCDETSVAEVCDIATSCKDKGDLQGLALGTWTGAVTTGTLEKTAADKVGGKDILTGLSLLSAIWLLINI